MTIDKERLRVLIKELRTDARVDSLFGGAARNKLSERAADVLTEFEAENAVLAAEVERLRATLEQTTAVAITMLFDSHPEDVKRAFSAAELEQVVAVTEPLHDKETQTEAVYRSAWDAAMADKGGVSES